MYSVKKVCPANLFALAGVAKILKDCGDDMYERDQLRHWKNSYIKTFLIAVYTALGNTVYTVLNENNKMIATFQTKSKPDGLHFGKLAVSPTCAGKGVGSFCLKEMERMARMQGLPRLICEVYDQSKRAYHFYMKQGFAETGKIQTLKYTELVLEKQLYEG